MRRYRILLATLFATACTGGGPSEPAPPGDADAAPRADTATDAAALDADALPQGPSFTRPEAGEPVPPAELAEVTALYLDLLARTRYFDATAERVHGWPRSDPEGRYWYGTWWSGVTVTKAGGMLTFLHGDQGADNNGMRSGPILAAACFAQALWGDREDLVRELLRGWNSWAMAWERPGYDTEGLLSRAAYPESVTDLDHGIPILIDYSLNRPGVDLDEPSPPSLYVHNPENPYWGDLWVKNKRSKDDIGHMLHALAMLPACSPPASQGLAEDEALAEDLYRAWCRKVEDDGWRIATFDPDWNEVLPPEDLAVYDNTVADLECKSRLAIRLFGRDDPGTLDCGNGISLLDEQWGLKNDYHQINRSHHEAAAAIAFLRGQPMVGDRMLEGLAWRLDTIFDARETDPDGYKGPHDQDLVELVLDSAAAGLPLTWREVRFVHDRIREAHASYVSEERLPAYDLTGSGTPDGDYPFEPGGAGIFWRDLGTSLGTCASTWRNPASRPLLDCDLVRNAHSATPPAGGSPSP